MSKNGKAQHRETNVATTKSKGTAAGVSRRALLWGLVVAGAGGAIGWNIFGAAPTASGPAVTVWKSPTCGCCGEWVSYMRRKGYAVAVHVVDDPYEIKQRLGVPDELWSCHTALIDGYVVEGHVPEMAIVKLLAERPALKGIALPGMPEGSPGMDGVPGRYRVVGFTADGRSRFFAEATG